MTVTPVAAVFVPAPPVTPLRYGLTDAVQVIDDPSGHWQLGVEYQPASCGPTKATFEACMSGLSVGGKEATDGRQTVTGHPFALYHLSTCRTVGTYADAEEYAQMALILGESRGVEEAVATIIEADPDLDDVTPGGSTDPVLALAVLEQEAAQRYGGVPIIHVPRGLGTVLAAAQAIGVRNGRFETAQGAIVASGGGYPFDSPVAMYATGTVVLRRGQIFTTPPVGFTGDGANEFTLLSERPFMASYECFAIKCEAARESCCR